MRCFVAAVVLLAVVGFAAAKDSDMPIIGVVTLPIGSGGSCEAFTMTEEAAAGNLRSTGRHLETTRGGGSCFTAFYVKWIEMTGARVAVIPYDAPEEELARLFKGTNGLLFTGGELDLSFDLPYYQTSVKLYNMAVEANKAGTYYPVWGTCQGFQMLNIITANDTSVLKVGEFDSESLSLHLDFTSEAAASRLMRSAPAEVVEILKTEEVTSNLHVSGVTPDTYVSVPALGAFWTIVSTNVDRKGKKFISTMEAKDFPFYGVQWHPERPQFEWSPNANINHSDHAVRAMQYFANFFVSEARKNTQAFPADTEWDSLIYKHQTTDLGKSYQVYFFEPYGATPAPPMPGFI